MLSVETVKCFVSIMYCLRNNMYYLIAQYILYKYKFEGLNCVFNLSVHTY